MKRRNSFKDYDVYRIIFFLDWVILDLTNLVYVREEKKPKTWKLHIFVISWKKNRESRNVNSNLVFHDFMEKKQYFFISSRKGILRP